MAGMGDFKGMSDFFQLINVDLQEYAQSSEYPCRPIKIYVPEYATVIGRFLGKIDLSNRKIFNQATLDLLNDQINKVIMDLAEAEFTKTGFGSLVAFAAMIHGFNKRLYLYRPSEQIQAKLSSLRLRSFFRVIVSEDDLIMSFIV